MSREADERDLKRFCRALDRAFAGAITKPLMAARARLEERGYNFSIDVKLEITGGPDRTRKRPRGGLSAKIGTADRAWLRSVGIAP